MFYLKMKMDDVSKRGKLLGNSKIGLYSCLFIFAPRFSKGKQPTLKGSFLVQC